MSATTAGRLGLTISERDHVQGSLRASITLLEYGDYECPYCGEAYSLVKAIQERLGDRLCFAFRNFPLTNAHPHAQRAAEAAEAAGAQGQFWEMHDMLYENQEALEDEDLADYAGRLGLDARGLLAAVKAGTYRERVREDFVSGVRGGVNGTPSFFINGIKYEGEYSFEGLLAALTHQSRASGRSFAIALQTESEDLRALKDGPLPSRRRRGGPECMTEILPMVCLARHGETAWSLSGQHTGLTDLPLTERGEREAGRLHDRLAGLEFAAVFTSPLQRAARTCELAGFRNSAKANPDLVEWNYGKYEGLRTVEIHQDNPDWKIFRDGCPGGESPDQVVARVDRVVTRARSIKGNVLIFSSGHLLRVLVARWLGMEPTGGGFFMLHTASVSMLGYENNTAQPVVRLWNDTRHLMD